MDLKNLSSNWKKLQGSLKKSDSTTTKPKASTTPAAAAAAKTTSKKRPASTTSTSKTKARAAQDGSGLVKRRKIEVSSSSSSLKKRSYSTAAVAPATAQDSSKQPSSVLRRIKVDPSFDFMRGRMGDATGEDTGPGKNVAFKSNTDAVKEGRAGDEVNAGLSKTCVSSFCLQSAISRTMLTCLILIALKWADSSR